MHSTTARCLYWGPKVPSECTERELIFNLIEMALYFYSHNYTWTFLFYSPCCMVSCTPGIHLAERNAVECIIQVRVRINSLQMPKPNFCIRKVYRPCLLYHAVLSSKQYASGVLLWKWEYLSSWSDAGRCWLDKNLVHPGLATRTNTTGKSRLSISVSWWFVSCVVINLVID